jgi:CrcB protein
VKHLLLVGFGGFLGSVARFTLSRFFQNLAFSSFPFGTLSVNIAGCFLIGLIYGISDRGNLFGSDLRLFLTIGFCGGFTTFSSFSIESMVLLKQGNFLYFALYASFSFLLCLIATWAGSLLAKIA